ncbi:MAG TPA: penicillin acylase family protein, partial [Pilimelia sp.]|nr:penicillin acylase family protein [Pilimelia sp.]
TRRHAYAVRDANSDNVRALDTWRLIAAARSTDDVRDALARTLGAPWLNTVASDRRGRVLYANIQAAPHVTDARVRRCAPDAAAVAEFRRTGRPTLDGSRSSCAWGSDPGAVLPGLFGPARQPVLERADWVGNANDSPWLTNPDAPLVGYPRVFGDVGTRRSPRTQELVVSVRGRLAGTDGQPGRGFTAASARDMLMAQHSRAAHLMRADLAAMCASFPDGRAPSAGGPVDVRAGCAALAAWDGRFTLDSRGALLFNLFWQRCTGECAGVRWRVPFDPADPVGTPYGLNGGDARVQRAFGDAAAALLAAGFPTDAPLRAGQRVTRGGAVVPIPGGLHGHGVLNVITPEPWVDGEGYTEIAHGSSYLHAVQFPAAGPPEGYVLLTYAQASDPTSPHHADQTLAFSAGRWERERFTEADVLASPALTVLRL